MTQDRLINIYLKIKRLITVIRTRNGRLQKRWAE